MILLLVLKLRLPLVSLLIFLIWWREYKNEHPTAVSTTWEQLKTTMQHKFVPSYYARDFLNKI
jgi:hypothetical protein